MSFTTLSDEVLKERYEEAYKKFQDAKGIDTGYLGYLTALELELRSRGYHVIGSRAFKSSGKMST